MNAKVFITILTAILSTGISMAQNQQPTDSLTRELQEVVVTARQPATKLVGSTLVSTIPGTNLAGLGNALDVLAQLPLINVQDNTVGVIGKKISKYTSTAGRCATGRNSCNCFHRI